MTDEELIDKIREKLKGNPIRLAVSEADIQRAEEMIGFKLPPLLESLYLKIGNGGFGPGYGLFPLFNRHAKSRDSDEGVVEGYLGYREAAFELEMAEDEVRSSYGHLSWAPLLIPLCEWGSLIRSAVNCADPSFPVILFDPNIRKGRNFTHEAPSLSQWLEDWLNGRWPPVPMFPINPGIK